MQIYNNTFVAKAGQPANFGLDFTSQPNGNVNGLYIRNNIFQGFGVASIANQAAQTQSNVVITHNDTWNTPAPTFAGGGVTMNNNLALNPLFVSASDFHLQSSSPLIDKGINVNLPYNGLAPDMGAYETGGTPPPPDTTAPTVSSTNPTNGATGVAVSSDVIATFSEALSSASVTPVTASIAGVTSAVILNGNLVTINPSANLAPSTTYTVTLMGGANGIKDLAGNSLASNYTFSFTTQAPANQSPTANAGANQTITLPTNSVTLSGSLSNDPDGTIVGWAWSRVSGSGTVNPTNTMDTTVTGLTAGVSVYKLIVTDNQGATGSATVTITVSAAPDTTPPTVSITSPLNGATIHDTQLITVNASDNVGIDHVDFYRSLKNGTQATILMGGGTPPSYSYSWDTTLAGGNGSYVIVAKAYDAATNSTTSTPITVNVLNTVNPGPDTTPPTVSWVSPVANASLASTVTLSANAGDNIGVTKVDFYRGTTIIDTDTTATGGNYSITWDTTSVANGTYSLTAKAYDAANNVTTSTPAISVTVNNIINPPSGTFTTWNPSDKGSNVILSNNNLTEGDNGYEGMVRAKMGKSSGKWYWEIKIDDRGVNQDFNFYPGVANLSAPKNKFLGYNKNGWGYWGAYGDKRNGNIKPYGPTFDEGDVIGVALDMSARTLKYYKKPAGSSTCTDLGVAFTNLSGTMYPAAGQFGGDVKITANFGASPFACPVPSGYNPGVY